MSVDVVAKAQRRDVMTLRPKSKRLLCIQNPTRFRSRKPSGLSVAFLGEIGRVDGYLCCAG
jgi:hypothetical protein